MKEKCPAYGKSCNKCGGRNHFAGSSRCKGVSVKALEVEEAEEAEPRGRNDDSPYFVGSLDEPHYFSDDTRVFADLTVHVGKVSNKVKFQLDPGSQVNTLCEKYVHESCVQKTSKTLKSWDGSLTQALGESKLLVTNPKSNKQVLIKFVIVPNDRSIHNSLIFINTNYVHFKVKFS